MGKKAAVVFAHVEFPSLERQRGLVKGSEVHLKWILSALFPSWVVGHKVKVTQALRASSVKWEEILGSSSEAACEE